MLRVEEIFILTNTCSATVGPLMAHMKNHTEQEGFSPVSQGSGMNNHEFDSADKAYINDPNTLVDGKPYCCNLCDYTTTVKGNLARHLSLHVEAKEIYKCHLCAFSTSQKISLSKHFRSHR